MMQVVLKEVAIVIRGSSEGNKIEIMVISFLVNKIPLNGMTWHFGRHDDYFR